MSITISIFGGLVDSVSKRLWLIYLTKYLTKWHCIWTYVQMKNNEQISVRTELLNRNLNCSKCYRLLYLICDYFFSISFKEYRSNQLLRRPGWHTSRIHLRPLTSSVATAFGADDSWCRNSDCCHPFFRRLLSGRRENRHLSCIGIFRPMHDVHYPFSNCWSSPHKWRFLGCSLLSCIKLFYFASATLFRRGVVRQKQFFSSSTTWAIGFFLRRRKSLEIFGITCSLFASFPKLLVLSCCCQLYGSSV